jgi:DNA-directed RNA polymerase subunit RPC12/RpoP
MSEEAVSSITKHWRLAIPSWSVGIFVLVAAMDAEAATRSLSIKEPNPLFADTTLMFANVGLVLVVVLQIARSFIAKKNKYKAVKDWQSPPSTGAASTPASSVAPPSRTHYAPSTPPAIGRLGASSAGPASVTRPPTAPAPATPTAATIVQCASCGQKLSLKIASRPAKFRCPKCQTVGVVK